MKKMTLRQLIEWAKMFDCLDCEIYVQYRDDGGLYEGVAFDILPYFEVIDGKKGHCFIRRRRTHHDT